MDAVFAPASDDIQQVSPTQYRLDIRLTLPLVQCVGDIHPQMSFAARGRLRQGPEQVRPRGRYYHRLGRQ